ncbi:MAG: carboxymuconolactone decarboxylase family protein [Pseudomonadales bacterium]
MTASRITSSPTEKTGNVVRDSALGLVPEVVEPYLKLNAAVWKEGPLSPAELEMIRLRNAREVGCVFCKAVRYDIATQAGLTEQKIEKIDEHFATSDLSEREKLILTFCEYYLKSPERISDATENKLRKEFTTAELAHMSLALLLFNTFSRCAVAFGGMPEHELPLMPMAVPE